MQQRIECILLVDDDNATNFIHNYLLKKSGVVDHVATVLNGSEALEYITAERYEHPYPTLILLDLNMPVMDGWDFLKTYALLGSKYRDIPIAILTTSISPDDEIRAQEIPLVKVYKNKPLASGDIQELIALCHHPL